MIHIPQKFIKGKVPLEKLQDALENIQGAEMTSVRGTRLPKMKSKYETVFVTTPNEQGMALAWYKGSSKYEIIKNVNGGYFNYIPFEQLAQWVAHNLKREKKRDKPVLEQIKKAFSVIGQDVF